MTSNAVYFDGNTAASHDVQISLDPEGIRISGGSIETTLWMYSDLLAIETPHKQRPLRLSCRTIQGSRLIVQPGPDADRITELATHLDGSLSAGRVMKYLGWAAGLGAVGVALIYIVLNFAPQSIARIMPADFRENIGIETEKSVVKGARQCSNGDGVRALLKLAAKVASGTDSPPDFSVRVYDMKLMNAFAVPGGRIVVTRGLLRAAETPGEVAGVIAHELGHVHHRHTEAALVRILGIQLLIGMFTGGGNSEAIVNFAGVATILSYSRGDERQADEFAQDILSTAKIDTVGLIDFFKRVKKLEDKMFAKIGEFKKALSLLSTHPGTQERIKKLKPLPKGEAIEVLTPLEWKALKNICSDTVKPTPT